MCDAFDKESFCFVREKKSEEITRVVGKEKENVDIGRY